MTEYNNRNYRCAGVIFEIEEDEEAYFKDFVI